MRWPKLYNRILYIYKNRCFPITIDKFIHALSFVGSWEGSLPRDRFPIWSTPFSTTSDSEAHASWPFTRSTTAKRAEELLSSANSKPWRKPFSPNSDCSSFIIEEKSTLLSLWILFESLTDEVQRLLTAVHFEDQILGRHFPDAFDVLLVLLLLQPVRRPCVRRVLLLATLSSVWPWTMMTKCRFAFTMNFFQISA